jgi:FkbM family methyltransferase
MFFSVRELVRNYNVRPKNILHVGAHLAEESSEYDKYFNAPVLWIEAQPQLCLELKKRLNPNMNTVIEACVLDKDDELLSFNISSNSQSSSLLNFGTHLINHPEVLVSERVNVKTKKLETILQGKDVPDFINLDIQGVELRAIKSLGDLINQVEVIYTEVNKRQVYENCDLIQDVDGYLKKHGFRRIDTRWKIKAGWGDALYVNKKIKRRSFSQCVRCKFRTYLFYMPQIKGIIKRS